MCTVNVSQMPRASQTCPIDSRSSNDPVGVEPAVATTAMIWRPFPRQVFECPVQGRHIQAKITVGDYDTGPKSDTELTDRPGYRVVSVLPVHDRGCGIPDAILPRVRQRPGSRGKERREGCLGAP